MQLEKLIGSAGNMFPGAGGTEIFGLTSDSRAVKPGFLFAALPGVNVDGMHYVADAVSRGAAAVLVPREVDITTFDVPFIVDRNPRRKFAQMAAAFYGTQPETIAAVTGTNGKTSVATFTRQIWEKLGKPAASLGTTGIATQASERLLGYTTPDPVLLHGELAALHQEGVSHLALEASSHGLAQYRLDAVNLEAAAFTNISRDHLDYHGSLEHYFYSKLRLFGEILLPGKLAVLNADSIHYAEFEAIAWTRGLRLLSVGRRGREICLAGLKIHSRGQTLKIVHEKRNYEIILPLIGGFQASNALVAAGIVIGLGGPPDAVFEALASLRGPKGRMEKVSQLANGAAIYIDYAHTPDALENALLAIRAHTDGKVLVVFGCGGGRDAGKRSRMGAVAGRLADGVFVTDDNPRFEEAEAIRREILAGIPDAVEIGDRREAIRVSIGALTAGDVLLIAGKGHETGQVVRGHTHPFSDHGAVASVLAEMGDTP